jgi:hypothetical protein
MVNDVPAVEMPLKLAILNSEVPVFVRSTDSTR